MVERTVTVDGITGTESQVKEALAERDAGKEAYRFSESTRTQEEQSYSGQMEQFITDAPFSNYEKMQNFPLFTARQDLTRYLTKVEIFKRVLNVQGSIVECGVLFGGGLMWWAHLSAIMEPVNMQRQIIGFDTFDGIDELAPEDMVAGKSDEAKIDGFKVDSKATLERAIELYDKNRTIGHIPKIEIVAGDACETIPDYLEANPHLLVSLLYLDFDIYAPTKTAIQYLAPRMPKGAVIAFDELNLRAWPGETQAVLEHIDINELKVERLPWGGSISFAVLGE